MQKAPEGVNVHDIHYVNFLDNFSALCYHKDLSWTQVFLCATSWCHVLTRTSCRPIASRAPAILLTVAAAILLLAGQCSQPAVSATAGTPTATRQSGTITQLKVAALLPGSTDDAGWTALAQQGLVEMRAKYGYEIAYSENVAVSEAGEEVDKYVKAGYNVIMAHGFEYSTPIHEAATEYPKVSFIQTNGKADDLKNLYTITFSAGEGGYFVGRLACQITQNDKVAYIAAVEYPILTHHMKMSRQACQDIGRGDVEIIEAYVGSWNDQARAKELAQAAIRQGVDVLILQADAGDPGTVEAAKEAAEEGRYIRVISWMRDKNYLAPDLVIGGWEESISRNIEYCLVKIAGGEPGGHFAIGLKEQAVSLNPFYGLVSAEVESDIVTTLQKYLQDPSSLTKLEVRTDL